MIVREGRVFAKVITGFCPMEYSEKDAVFMQNALQLARRAFEQDEVPVGALVISPGGEILGQGYNRTEELGCQDQHAEMIAIRQACALRGDWRLDDCTLYVTLEPCVMCLGCIALSRIGRLVFGADSPHYGYRGQREDLCRLYAQTIKNVTTGVCKEEVELLLKEFFKKQRKRDAV
ncbi:MAG: tRNA-adenosine deaminase [candidate division TM6 bacterium GW2011_GWE2_42_60]|nr:MAG: tRNA-adenosine deaminase [candidate division TM6 bacterium GW2011_GWE2_42_60]